MDCGSLLCSEAECKRRLADVKNMDFGELEEYCIKCAKCGNWLLKENETANKTYEAVSNRWAEEFMSNLMKG
jgi:hypothetical protein